MPSFAMPQPGCQVRSRFWAALGLFLTLVVSRDGISGSQEPALGEQIGGEFRTMSRTSTGRTGGRPMVMASKMAVSSGHYLATEIGMHMLRQGGNAFDAAAAVGFALAVLKPHQNGIGGEVPILVYDAAGQKFHAISGNGIAPRAATLEKFVGELGLKVIPGDGLLPAVVPSAVATWLLLLGRFGSQRLADVLAGATHLAEGGFPMYDALRDSIAQMAGRFRSEWPSSADVFLPEGQVPASGRIWRQPVLAETLRRLSKADAGFNRREDGLRAAYEAFYRGGIAGTVCDFCRSQSINDASGRAHRGLLTPEDFALYAARLEEPVSTRYRDLEVIKCGPWTQGPVLLEMLNLLEGFDLRAMGHDSADFIHTVVEAMKLAFADREFYYGDPDFVKVPLDRLLSKTYAEERRALIAPESASLELRPGGFPSLPVANVSDVNEAFAGPRDIHGGGDTTKLEVVDGAGNLVSATPSGGWLMSSPVIPGLGFPLGTRGQMFSLSATHPNRLEPGKRPRTTLTPGLAARNGKGFMAFGSPGGDAQDQWALQFLLNVVEFGMSLQEAVEAPTFWTNHFPSSFHPRHAEPGSLVVEGRIPIPVREELAARGHRVTAAGDFSGGNTLAAGIDEETGVRLAAASPRLEPASAAGW